MSNLGDAALALALGAGGGFLLWHLARKYGDGGASRPDGRPAKADAPAPPPRRATSVCSLKLDATGLTADGKPVDVATAVDRCKSAGRAEVLFAADGPAQVYVDLSQAFAKAGIPITVRRP